MMNKKPILLLYRLAKIREDQAMARARIASSKVNQTIEMKNQVLEYAKDYEKQMMESGPESLSVAFLQDANAFREKLIHSSIKLEGEIQGLTRSSEGTLKNAMQARMRTLGLGKLVNKIKHQERVLEVKKELNEFEESYVGRMKIKTGMKDA